MLELLIALVMGAGAGEVVDSSESGFTSRNSVQVAVPPDAKVVDGVVHVELESLAQYVDEP